MTITISSGSRSVAGSASKRRYSRSPTRPRDYRAGGFLLLKHVTPKHPRDSEIDEDEFGWGLHGSFSANVFGGDTIVANIQGGDGIGRHMLSSGLDAFIDASGELETVSQYAFSVGYGHRWNDFLKSFVAFGRTHIDDDDVPATVPNVLQTLHVNLQWSPVPRVNLGAEVVWGRAEVEDNPGGDDENDQIRLQVAGRFNF